jgi:hypothetical protein
MAPKSGGGSKRSAAAHWYAPWQQTRTKLWANKCALSLISRLTRCPQKRGRAASRRKWGFSARRQGSCQAEGWRPNGRQSTVVNGRASNHTRHTNYAWRNGATRPHPRALFLCPGHHTQFSVVRPSSGGLQGPPKPLNQRDAPWALAAVCCGHHKAGRWRERRRRRDRISCGGRRKTAARLPPAPPPWRSP